MGRSVVGLNRRELLELLDAIVTLSRARMGLVEAVHASAPSLASRASRVALAVAHDLESGAGATEAFETHAGPLPAVLRSMLRITDESGEVTGPLSFARDQLETSGREFRALAGAAVYPAFVALLTTLAAVVLLLWVLPAAGRLLEALGTPSAAARAEAVVRSGRRKVVVALGLMAAGGAAAGWLAATSWSSAPSPLADALRLRLPVIGPLERTRALLVFVRGLAAVANAGVPLPVALEAAASCVTNGAIRHRLAMVRPAVESGWSSAAAIEHALPGYPEVHSWLGRHDGGADLDASLGGLAACLASRSDRMIAHVTRLAEPALTVAAGSLLLVLVLTIVRPLFGLYSEMLP